MGTGERAKGRAGGEMATGESYGGAEEEVTTERTRTKGVTEEVTGGAEAGRAKAGRAESGMEKTGADGKETEKGAAIKTGGRGAEENG